MSDDPCIDLLNQYGVPFVAIGRIDDPEIPQADNDQLGAACEMTRLLLQLGTRRIAYLGGSGTYTVNADRLRGYLRGLAEFGVQADQTLIHTGLEATNSAPTHWKLHWSTVPTACSAVTTGWPLTLCGSCGHGISMYPRTSAWQACMTANCS